VKFASVRRFPSLIRGLRSPKRLLSVTLLLVISLLAGCKHGSLKHAEMMYVAVPQANLRDRVSAVYNKVETVYGGAAVEVLEKQKRFIHVKTSSGKDGWLEERYLVGQDVFDGFEKLKKDNEKTPVQAHGTARAELNIHLTAEREGEHLFQMKEGEKAEILRKASALRNAGAAKPAKPIPAKSPVKKNETPGKPVGTPAKASSPGKAPTPAEEPPAMEDWWLIRDSFGHVGWVLMRMIDIDVPVDVAQYAEGQRIVGYFVLNKIQDGDKQEPQYLVLMSAPKDGLPYDYDSIRVFSWNAKRHHYETAYRERNIFGVYPVNSGMEDFGKEGSEPVFTIQVKDETGAIVPRKYRMIQPVVRRVLLPGQSEKTDPKLARPELAKKSAESKTKKRR
jgi:SH3-like domain-containing protein